MDRTAAPGPAALPRVLQPQRASAYSPSNHTGTRNRRIVAPDTVGARRMEVLAGTIARGGRGLPHAHPALEQAGIVLAGRAVSTLGGVTRELCAGDVDFIPRNVFHAAEVVSEEPLELVVVYAPPYLENPEARVLAPTDDAPAPEVPPPVRLPPPGHGAELSAGNCVLVPLLDASRTGARHLAIAHLRMAAGAIRELPAPAGAEQLLMLRTGSVVVLAGVASMAARAGDWVFIPEDVACSIAAGAAGVDAILVTARGEPAAAG